VGSKRIAIIFWLAYLSASYLLASSVYPKTVARRRALEWSGILSRESTRPSWVVSVITPIRSLRNWQKGENRSMSGRPPLAWISRSKI
jgi:hypothetical protein